MQAMSNIGVFISFLISICILLGIAALLVKELIDLWHIRKYNEYKRISLAMISEWSRWLSADFPIVSKVLEDLRQDVEDGAYREINSYRQQLRREFEADRKYKGN